MTLHVINADTDAPVSDAVLNAFSNFFATMANHPRTARGFCMKLTVESEGGSVDYHFHGTGTDGAIPLGTRGEVSDEEAIADLQGLLCAFGVDPATAKSFQMKLMVVFSDSVDQVETAGEWVDGALVVTPPDDDAELAAAIAAIFDGSALVVLIV